MKRQSLVGVIKADAEKAQSQLDALSNRTSAPKRAKKTGYTSTAIHLKRDNLTLLRRAATERANRDGGRASVSAVLDDLVDRHRAELEEMAKR